MDMKQLIETVKGLDDVKLKEFLTGLGLEVEDAVEEIKGEVEKITEEGVPPAEELGAKAEEVKDIAVTEEKGPIDKEAVALAEDAKTDETVKAEAADVIEEITENQEAKAAGEDADYDKVGKEETELVKAVEEDKKADAAVEENAGDITTGANAEVEDDIPVMVRGKEPVEEGAEVVPPADPVPAPAPVEVTSDDGKTIPTDFESIIAGLNAKNAALESENAILKQKADKVDAAFGYAARPAEIVKVDNGLYDPNFKMKMHR